MENVCRICLGQDAINPIFENDHNTDNVQSKLTLCVKEKVEDLDGYPRKICNSCNETLDYLCVFINKYRKSHKILESGLIPIKEEKCYNNNHTFTDIDLNIVKEENNILIDYNINEKIKKLTNLSIKKIAIPSEIKCEIDDDDDFEWAEDSIKQEEIPPKESVKSKKANIKKVVNKQTLRKKVEKSIEKPTKRPSHIDDPKPQKLCDACGEVFPDMERLKNHRRRVHGTASKCPLCEHSSVSPYYLNKHIKRKHTTEKNFLCTICPARFAYQGELTSHYKCVHTKKTGPPRTWSCKICGKTYKCPKSVVVHERAAHTGERPAVCKFCDASFFHEDYLKEHMRLHTGETPFKCPICGRGYAQRCNMKSHLRIHKVSEVDPDTLSKMRPNYLRLLKA